MDILKDRYTITELSKKLSVTDHTLRYYEKEFGINVPKDERGRRYYTPDLTNLLFQIKAMRNEGLEIKAIKKILQSENSIPEQTVMLSNNSSVSIVSTTNSESSLTNINEFKEFFSDLKEQITDSIIEEAAATRCEIAHNINRSKLELGACMENSMRKLESKMEKHFDEVDYKIGVWREKNKAGLLKRILRKR